MSTVKENKLKDFLGSEFAKKASELLIKVATDIIQRRKDNAGLDNDSYPIFKFRRKVVKRLEQVDESIENILEIRKNDEERISKLEEAISRLTEELEAPVATPAKEPAKATDKK